MSANARTEKPEVMRAEDEAQILASIQKRLGRDVRPHVKELAIEFDVERYFRDAKAQTRAEWVEWFRDKDVCFAPVQDFVEAYGDPQARAREMVLEDTCGWQHIGLPVKFRNEPGRPSFDYPEPGDHSDEILRRLGYAERELVAMKEKGVY